MKSLWLGALVSSVLVSFAACSSSSSTGGGSGGNDSGTSAANDSGSSSSGDSGATSGDEPLSCFQSDGTLCTHYAEIPKGAESVDCASPDTIVAACSTTDVQATCTYTAGGTDQEIFWYKSGGHANSALKSTCDALSGAFTAS